MGYRDYSTAKGHIVDAKGHGDFTTISAAITAASVGETIFIRPGTYTENPTLKAGVNLTAFECDSPSGTVTILGELSYSVPGTVIISGISFETNGSYALSLTGANASIVTFIDCYFTATNFTLINFTNSNSASTIQIQYGGANLATTGVALYSMTSPGSINIFNSGCGNSGSSTTVSSNSAGEVNVFYSIFEIPLSCTGTGGLEITYCDIFTSNVTSATFNGTGNNTAVFSSFSSGSVADISVGVGAVVALDNLVLASSDTYAVTGAGSVDVGYVTFFGPDIFNPTLTVSYIPLQANSTNFSQAGVTTNPKQPCFLAVLGAAQFNVTGDGTVYQIPFDTIIFDQASNFTTGAAAKFTAPVTGKYFFSTTVSFLPNATSGGQYDLNLVAPSATLDFRFNAPVATLSSVIGFSNSGILSMTAGDTLIVNAIVSGGAKTTDIVASTSPLFTYISGYLVC